MELHTFMGLRVLVGLFLSLGCEKLKIFQGCWITKEFPVQRTAADFLWMWISAFSSVLAYVAVFLVLGGFVKVKGWRVRRTPGQESPSITLAYKMLA